MEPLSIVIALGVALVGFWAFTRFVRIVPEQQTHIVERLGKFARALGPGFHLIIPLVERVAYKHSLKEEAIDVDPQVCITNDNVQVSVDGILYMKVIDPQKASYGIDDYRFATAQLAQTTMRSEMGKIDLDRSFSERESLNNAIVRSVDQASDPWGIKVTRYEIKDIAPPGSILQAMEQQMRAEREKRAQILESEGDKESRINASKGEREEAINLSRGERQRRINTAEGRAKSIEVTAQATADGIREIATAIQLPKGKEAMAMRIAEQFVGQFGQILDKAKTTVMPIDVAQIRALLQTVLPGRAAGEAAGGAATARTPSAAPPIANRVGPGEGN